MSWYAIARPSLRACAGESRRKGWPPIRTVPRSGSTNPLAIPRRVDFPEPFSPTSAWTSPARQSKLTSRQRSNRPELPGHARAARGPGPPSPTLLRDRCCSSVRVHQGEHGVRHQRGARHGRRHPVRVAVRRRDLPHDVRHDDLGRDRRPWRYIIEAVTATRDWKLPPAEYQMLKLGSSIFFQVQNRVCSSVRSATVRFPTGMPSSSYAFSAVLSPSAYSYAYPAMSGFVESQPLTVLRAIVVRPIGVGGTERLDRRVQRLLGSTAANRVKARCPACRP